MEPRYLPGDRVVFNLNLRPRNGDVCIFKIKETEGVLLNRYFETGKKGEKVKLVSDNPDFEERIFSMDQFLFIYPAWETIRREKR